MSRTVRTPFARLSYPNLFESRADANGRSRYSCALLFPKDFNAAGARLGLPPALIAAAATALDDLKRLAAEVAIDYFGGKDKIPAPIKQQALYKGSGWPFRDQEDKEGQGYEPGALYVNVGSKERPGLVNRDMSPITDPSLLYPGCWVRASLTAYGFDQQGNKGVSFGLSHIQKVCDDEPISGRTRAEDDFEPIEGTGATGAPAESMFD